MICDRNARMTVTIHMMHSWWATRTASGGIWLGLLSIAASMTEHVQHWWCAIIIIHKWILQTTHYTACQCLCHWASKVI